MSGDGRDAYAMCQSVYLKRKKMREAHKLRVYGIKGMANE